MTREAAVVTPLTEAERDRARLRDAVKGLRNNDIGPVMLHGYNNAIATLNASVRTHNNAIDAVLALIDESVAGEKP